MHYNHTMKKLFTALFFILALMFFQLPVFALDAPRAAVEFYNAGIDYYNAGNVEKSIDSFKKALAIEPKFYEALYNLSQIQTSSGKFDDAIKTYTAILEIEPDDEECIFGMANALHKRGYLKRSLSYLDRIPSDSEYYNRAQKLVDKILARQRELEIEAAKKEAELKKAQEKVQEGAAENTTGGKSTIYSGIPNPSGVAADSLGNIYIASYSENIIYKINKNNQKSVFVTSDALGGPIGLAVDSNNNLYVANYTKNNILKVAPNGTPAVFLNISKPYCLNVSTGVLYVTEQESNTTIKFQL